MNYKNLDLKIIPIPYRTDTVTIISIQAHPHLDIKELCNNIGIDHKRQFKRLEKYSDILRLTPISFSVERQTVGIPLENLSWFLLSLRPRGAKQKEKLADYRDSLTWAMLYFWYRYMKNYTTPEEFAKHLKYHIAVAKASPLTTQNLRNACQPERQSSPVSADLVMEMRRLKAEGKLSQNKIASKLGVSPATVSLCLRGLYPVQSLCGET